MAKAILMNNYNAIKNTSFPLVAILLSGLLLLFVFPSCKKIEKLTNFYTGYSDSLIVNPEYLNNSTFDIWTFKIFDNGKDLYGENQSDIGSTQSIKLNNVNLSLGIPDTATLNFIESISVNIKSAQLEEKKIAWIDDFQYKDIRSINLEVYPDDLQDYILEKDFIFHIIIKSKTETNIDYNLNLTYSFFISSRLTDI